MSSNATSSGVTASPSAVPSAPDPNAIIHPSLNTIMIGHTFLTLLLPLFIALFYFSTPQSRRRTIFILNVVAIILAFTGGAMVDAFAIHSILSPRDLWPLSVNISIGIIGAFQSILVDIILLVRLVLVHPLSRLGLTKFAMLTFLPILLKVGRVVNLIVFIKVLSDAARGPLGPVNLGIVWATTPYLKIEWSAQVVDNAYASLAFLWTIRDRGSGQGITSNVHPDRATFAQRMRTLSHIALSNFVVPSLFSIAQLVVVYRNVNVLIVNEIVLVNTMLAVFGVVFATVWAGNVGRRREAELDGWEDASRTTGDDHDPGVGRGGRRSRAFAFPGLGTWRVASTPRTMTGLESSGYDVRVGNVARDGMTVSEKLGCAGDRDVLVGVRVGTTGSVEAKGDEDVSGSSGPSTPSH